MPKQKFIQALYQNHDLNKREIDLVLCHFLKVNTAGLMIFHQPISESMQQKILTALENRIQGMPLAYITGVKGFWSLDLKVNQHTLIPRPETELIVELILKWTDRDFSGSLLDLGTGTGAIALSIAKERPNAKICAVDFSSDCIKVAQTNRKRYQLDNVELIKSDWFAALNTDTKFDFIVSNPPYVAENDPHLKELSFEPITALTAKNKGLADIEKIINQARSFLKPDSKLLIEHGYDQRNSIHKLFKQYDYASIKTYHDLSDIPRITSARY